MIVVCVLPMFCFVRALPICLLFLRLACAASQLWRLASVAVPVSCDIAAIDAALSCPFLFITRRCPMMASGIDAALIVSVHLDSDARVPGGGRVVFWLRRLT